MISLALNCLPSVRAPRCIKYTVMGYLARYAPNALRFFGIDTKKLLAYV